MIAPKSHRKGNKGKEEWGVENSQVINWPKNLRVGRDFNRP